MIKTITKYAKISLEIIKEMTSVLCSMNKDKIEDADWNTSSN